MNNNENNTLLNAQVYDKQCRGCIAANKDIMLSITIENDQENDLDKIYDIFLTQEQAINLMNSLRIRIQDNFEHQKQEEKL